MKGDRTTKQRENSHRILRAMYQIDAEQRKMREASQKIKDLEQLITCLKGE